MFIINFNWRDKKWDYSTVSDDSYINKLKKIINTTSGEQ